MFTAAPQDIPVACALEEHQFDQSSFLSALERAPTAKASARFSTESLSPVSREILKILLSPELRTAAIVDRTNILSEYPALLDIPTRVYTIVARPETGSHPQLPEHVVALPTEKFCAANTEENPLAITHNQIDVLFVYHDGVADKRNLILANRLLSENGTYIDIFIHPLSESRIVTLFSREEVRSLTKPIAGGVHLGA